MHIFNTTCEAYLGMLELVLNHPEFVCEPRGLRIHECLNVQFKVNNPTSSPIVTKDPERNECIRNYVEKEFALYKSGSRKVEEFAKASKFWKGLANPDGTINSAYGWLIWKNKSCGNPQFERQVVEDRWRKASNREPTIIDPNTGKVVPIWNDTEFMRTPWEWAVRSLIADRDSRQAIIRFSLPEHQWDGNKDQTCTMHGVFMIRDNKLHLTIVMRSNDLVKGLVYDLPWFCSLLHEMKAALYAVEDNGIHVEIGSYTHIAHSLHIYEQDFEKVKKMLGYA